MIENLENEQWLPIDGFDDYEVSNYGRVKSLGNDKKRKEKILKQGTNKKGYQQVNLYKDCKRKMFRVNRLVAMAFINNPNNLPQVNHIDENKCNNHVSNLEWCTAKYNVNYGARNKKASKTMSGKYNGENHPLYGKLGKEHPRSKQIVQLTLGGEVVRKWGCITDVTRELGYNNSNISQCCKGRLKHAYKYKWCYD